MESYSIEDRIIVIKEHYKNGEKIKNTFRALRDHLGRPNETTIGRLMRKFEATGSVGDAPKSGRPKSVRTPENIATVSASVRDNPKTSTTRLLQELGISRRSLGRILHKDLMKSTVMTSFSNKMVPRPTQHAPISIY